MCEFLIFKINFNLMCLKFIDPRHLNLEFIGLGFFLVFFSSFYGMNRVNLQLFKRLRRSLKF